MLQTAHSLILLGQFKPVTFGMNPNASAPSAIQAAKDRMERVTRYGD